MKKKKTSHRERNVQINLRVTPEEKAYIESKMELAGVTNREAYLRKMALDGMVVRIESALVQTIAVNLRRSGVLLNQLVKRTLSNQALYSTDLEALQDMYRQLSADVEKILEWMEKL